MCWNKEVSLLTFVLAIIGVAYLYRRNAENDRWIALFGGTVAMIQLTEYFMWSDQACGKINQLASMFALLILALEPFSNMIGGIYLSNSTNKSLLRIMLTSYIVFIFFVYVSTINNHEIEWCGINNCSVNPSANKCNLQWNFLNTIDPKIGIVWILYLMLPLLT